MKRSEESKRLYDERLKRARATGFIPVDEAAALVVMPRSNIYHWIRSGEIRTQNWAGANTRPVLVSLADLKSKVPTAFGGGDVPPRTTPQTRLHRVHQLIPRHARALPGVDVTACGIRDGGPSVKFGANIRAITCPKCKVLRKVRGHRAKKGGKAS
jgi:hypothetical protein